MTRTLSTYAARIAAQANDGKARFSIGSLIAAANDDGHSLADIATAVQVALLDVVYPHVTNESERAGLLTKARENGIGFSKAAAGFYLTAWKSTVKAGFAEPTSAVYLPILRLVERAGATAAREALVKGAAAIENEGERQVYVVTEAARLLSGVVKVEADRKASAPTTGRSGGTDTGTTTGRAALDADGIPTTGLEGTVGKGKSDRMTVQSALNMISAITSQTWSPADAERLIEAFAVSAVTITAPVDAPVEGKPARKAVKA